MQTDAEIIENIVQSYAQTFAHCANAGKRSTVEVERAIDFMRYALFLWWQPD